MPLLLIWKAELNDVIISRGLKFPDDPAILGRRQKRLLRSGRYEARESAAALKAIREDDTVLELGGGIGFVSSLIARECRPRAIHVIEANPALLPYIAEVHRMNDLGGISLRNALPAPKDGPPLPFYVRGDFLASSTKDDLGSAHGGVTRVDQVPQVALDTVLKETGATVLVCDIEGAETELFPQVDFTSLRLVIVELHPQTVGQQGIQAVFDAMARANLTYFPRQSSGKVVMFKRDW
ncbi:methyltransferase, FkbM family [Poseidonocella pacifica]|uniref:Methyltransferase, FkbM family n=1 Tax=Poseidonocella pacifica TaxID=871651 RepID=A0A1I0V6V3_9RHOB|nr:FkbM family methyltransferase [Poseidonocella pacifica]SFA71787.1 methyltransferase, FkbM family [Poseidonocella pacifica]